MTTLPQIQPIDSRLKLLSNSSNSLLHGCPRKYQLQKLWPKYVREDSVHTVFGKMFGEGLQSILSGYSLEESLVRASSQWTLDLYESLKEKSFFSCWNAIQTFAFIYPQTPLKDYEVVIYNGKPACELSFCLALPDGFYYRGYMDIVLKHKYSDTYLVVDFKTSGAKYSNPAKYQNSPQALGYSIIMDKIAPGYQNFSVMYYEYLTYLNKFVDHDFVLDYLDRAMWIRDLLIDVELIKLYSQYAEWPKHGHHCTSYGGSCEFIQNCGMQTKHLIGTDIITQDALTYEKDKAADSGKELEYSIYLTLDELIQSQLERG